VRGTVPESRARDLTKNDTKSLILHGRVAAVVLGVGAATAELLVARIRTQRLP
jgi:hypothetical protein